MPKALQAYDAIKDPKKPRPRGRERFESLRDENLRAYVRSLPCLVCTIRGEQLKAVAKRVTAEYLAQRGFR